MHIMIGLSLGFAAIILAACSGLPSVGGARAPAVLIFFGDTATIDAPDTVNAGTPFRVRITTFGGGCVRRTDGADMASRGGAIEIRPYNHDTGGPICTSDLLYLVHDLEVRAPAAGPFVLRVIGGKREGGAPVGATAQLERRIVAH